ncbi:FH1/FH2 domain-containing protein 3-like, partial [Dipodomys merriami]|uniref:FH1/FH2 domain-containing protein 3-like n=1 Tax=Dipodomys merriami TaxID=94247 RepID=UPI0038560C2F
MEKHSCVSRITVDIKEDTDDEDEVESGKFSGNSPVPPSQPQGLSYAEDAAEHENMKAVLKTSSPAVEDATPVLVRTRSRASREWLQLHEQGSTSSWTMGTDDSPNVTDDAADEIMDRIVKSATQVPSQRVVPRERKRSRANRKSRSPFDSDGSFAQEKEYPGGERSMAGRSVLIKM